MKNVTKRLLAGIVAAGTLLTVVPVFAEVGGEITKSVDNSVAEQAENDKLKANYAQELALLSGLGIINDTNIKMNNSITRGEFLNLVMKMIKMDGLTTDEADTIFYDVLPESDYYNAVMSAHKLGLINGDDQGCFNPDKAIDGAGAVKILVCALDFRSVGEAKGGYPNGFVSVARDLGIADGIKISADVKWADAVRIIYDALYSGAAVKSYSADGLETTSVGDETVLYKNFGVVGFKGIVEETNLTLRMQGKEEESTTLQISGKTYKNVGASSAEGDDLLGKAVVYYIKEETDEIICITEDTKYNTTTIIDPEDIESANVSSIKYWDENDKEKRISISDDAVFYYNGVMTDSEDISGNDLKPENGKITLIDNNNNKTADVVIIESWTDMVLARTSMEVLASMYNDGKTINLKETDMIFYKNGFEINKYYLGEWNILKIMMSKDGKAGMTEISSHTLIGNVTQVNKKQNDKMGIMIDGEWYELAQTFIDAYERGDRAAKKPVKGENYTFVLDDRNVIYGISDTNADEFKYGYLVGAESEKGLSDNSRVKIYGYLGDMQVYECTDTVKVNGKRTDNVVDALSDRYDRVNPQPIMYKTTVDGKLLEIKTAVDARNNGVGYDLENFSLDKTAQPTETFNSSTQQKSITGWSYASGLNKIIDEQVEDDGKTAIFYIPKDRTDEDAYRFVIAYGNLGRWSNKYTDVELYDLVPYADDGKYHKVSMIYLYERDADIKPYSMSSLSGSGDESGYWAVNDVYETVAADGEVVIAIDATSTSGTKATYEFAENAQNADLDGALGNGGVSPSEIEEGDIIKIAYDDKYGKNPRIGCYAIYGRAEKYRIDGFKKIYYEPGMYDYDWDAYVANKRSSNLLVYGEVYYITENLMIVKTIDENGKEQYYGTQSTSSITWEYSVSEKKLRLSNISAVGTGDRICLGMNWLESYGVSYIVRIVE